MKILFLSTRSPYPLISGHSLRTYHILKGAAQRHNIILLTCIQLEDELKEDNIEHLKSFCSAVYPFRIPVDGSRTKLTKTLFLNLFSPLPFVAQKYDMPEMRKKIREIVQKEKIDLVHVDMLPLTQYINEFMEIPKILVNHNIESIRLFRWFQAESNLLKKIYLGIQWLKLKSYEAKAVGRFNACVVVSEYDKGILQKISPNAKIFVVPNGTNTSYFQPGIQREKPNSVIWVGHMDVHTNRDAVLYFLREIYPVLKKQNSNVQITFVGTSPPEEIVAMAKRDKKISTTGFVEDIRPFVQESAVFIVPIRIGSGTRLKILDAMAMGKAIVSTSVGCEGIDVTDSRDIMIADSPIDFSSKIIYLLKNEEAKLSLGKMARELSKKYDWGKITILQENVYQEALRQ